MHRGALALGLGLAAVIAGCREDRCRSATPSFEVDLRLEAGIDGRRVAALLVQLNAAGLRREKTLAVAGKLDDGETSFAVDVGPVGSRGFTIEVTVTARDTSGNVVAVGQGVFNAYGDACNFFTLTLRGDRIALDRAGRDAGADVVIPTRDRGIDRPPGCPCQPPLVCHEGVCRKPCTADPCNGPSVCNDDEACVSFAPLTVCVPGVAAGQSCSQTVYCREGTLCLAPPETPLVGHCYLTCSSSGGTCSNGMVCTPVTGTSCLACVNSP